MATKKLTANQLIEQLHKVKYFDGYNEKAQAMAEAKIGERFDAPLSSGKRKFMDRFPATATASLTVYGEWDYEPFEPLVELYADGSYGMFRPTKIKDERDDENDQMTLSFEAGGKSYSVTAESQGWVPPEFQELLEQAVKETCNGLEFHLVYEGGRTDSPSFTFCKKEAYDALIKSKLICDDHEIAFSDEYE
jgi:hypothetical protein